MEEAAAAAQSLEEQARLLRETVASFRLPQGGGEVRAAAPAVRAVAAAKPAAAATVARPAVRKPAATVRARAPRKPAAEAPVAKAASSPAPAEPAGGKLALSAAVDQDDWTQF
uniref:Methyl-accepting chemotaxis protein n=1 Tax=Ralstonia solanacearum TaxID=305 RepID=A0A0S4UEQ0_RALSL|nr:protein of unknown function [Ralstonia solanacearum]